MLSFRPNGLKKDWEYNNRPGNRPQNAIRYDKRQNYFGDAAFLPADYWHLPEMWRTDIFGMALFWVWV